MINKINIDKKLLLYRTIGLVVFLSFILSEELFINSCSMIGSPRDPEKIELFQRIFPDIKSYIYQDAAETYLIYGGNRTLTGYAFFASGEGFGGEISILIGLKNTEIIEGIVVISHYESPDGWLGLGWGNRITETYFTDQFVNLDIKNCDLSTNNGQIDALTGATISSQSVVDIVREKSLEKIQLIKQFS
ncbi:MAG: FMN-binding protein [Eubacteriales bacterium]